MVAQTLPPDHPGTEVAPSRLCWMLHWSALRRSSHLYEADRERAALKKAIALRPNGCGSFGRASLALVKLTRLIV
jgi:hypothetical protein